MLLIYLSVEVVAAELLRFPAPAVDPAVGPLEPPLGVIVVRALHFLEGLK